MAMVLSIAVLVALGLSLDVGHTAPAKQLKAKLLRPANSDFSKLTDAEKDYLQTHAAVQEEKKEEREFENKVPGHLPIKVKLRAEKEKAAEDMANDRWHRDLELEVKNTGDKPIYYMYFILEMPEINPGGATLSFTLQYGKRSLFGIFKGRAEAEDIPLNPKDTLFLRLDDGQVQGWEIAKARDKWPQPKRIVIECQELNFGDGTGFLHATPWPVPKNKPPSQAVHSSLTLISDIRSNHHRTSKNPILESSLNGGESAILWPTTFRSENLTSTLTSVATASTISTELCCPNDCRFVSVYRAQFCYYCSGDLPHADGMACLYDFDGICATVQLKSVVCSDGNSCTYEDSYPCGSGPIGATPTPSPTPTPTPTPEPTCNPATKPNNTNCVCGITYGPLGSATAEWGCACTGGTAANYPQFPGTQGYGGCPQGKYNNGSDCCICIVQNCPDGSPVNSSTCQCPTPTPNPTATPANGGGGGYEGGGDGGGYCTEYFWVWYVWINNHWVLTGDRDYAGCW